MTYNVFSGMLNVLNLSINHACSLCDSRATKQDTMYKTT